MKVKLTLFVMIALLAGCGDKKDKKSEADLIATLPDGTRISLNKDKLYEDDACELDNVLTSTYRKQWFMLSESKFYIWDVVFLSDACDTAQEHTIFGSPLSWTIKDFDGSQGTLDTDEDQVADYEIRATADQLTLHPLFEDEGVEDESFAKAASIFSPRNIFDISLDVATPTRSAASVLVEFTVTRLGQDLLVDGTSYLNSVRADVICELANGQKVFPALQGVSRKDFLDGAGSYKASASLSADQSVVALKSCEVSLSRIYESQGTSTKGVEIMSNTITFE